MPTLTPNLSLQKPLVNDPTDEDLWGGQLNDDLDILDTEAATKTINQSFEDLDLSRPVLKDYAEKLATLSVAANVLTVDIEDGNHAESTLDQNVTTLTINNASASGDVCVLVLYLKQDGTGSRVITWPASIIWAGGAAPILTITAGRTDEFVLITRDGGTSWSGSTRGLNFNI